MNKAKNSITEEKCKPKPDNFLNGTWSVFSDKALDAASNGRLEYTLPLLMLIHRVMVTTTGISEVLKIQQNNLSQQDLYDDREPDEVIEPPLSNFTISALTNLALFAAEEIAGEIERISNWVDEHGIKKDGT